MTNGNGGDVLPSNAASAASVDRVKMQPAPFIPSDPELWFMMLDANFAAADITSDIKKYAILINSLPSQYATQIKDLLVSANNSYASIKPEIIKRFGESQEAKLRKLLEQEDIGDRKPTQFLRHIKELAGTSVPESLLKTM